MALSPEGVESTPAPVPMAANEVQQSGYTLTLKPYGTFEKSSWDKVVRTLVGNTTFSSGSVFRAGSVLKMDIIVDSQQFDRLLVTFAYTPATNLKGDGAALDSIAQAATLVGDGATYRPIVAWVTDQYLCLAFDDDTLKGAGRFLVRLKAARWSSQKPGPPATDAVRQNPPHSDESSDGGEARRLLPICSQHARNEEGGFSMKRTLSLFTALALVLLMAAPSAMMHD